MIYIFVISPSIDGKEKIWMLRLSSIDKCCKFHIYLHGLHCRQCSKSKPKLIYLDDLKIKSIVGAIPSMSGGQHSCPALHVAHET